MRLAALFASICFCLVGAAQAQVQELVPLNTKAAKKISDAASYGLGFQAGANFKQGGLTAELISQTDFLAGFMDALGGKELAVADKEIQAAMEVLAKKIDAAVAAVAKDNLANSNKFLEVNKKKQGVQTTASGLQYEVMTSGKGPSPKADSTVTVHYEGKLMNGKIFDSSIKRGEPTSFPLNQVIPGWTEGLQRMKVGDKWRLFIPPNLGYGERGGPGGAIGPNEALVFEIELLEVK
jgi:FKBP-type peptidyl-prolyl cis-trans isomerase